jgi:hypothetical protein
MNRVVVVTGIGLLIAELMGACGGGTAASGESSAKDSGVSSSDGGDNDDGGGGGSDGSVSNDASVVTVNDGGNTDVGTCVSTFGSGMVGTYGRLDGTLHAIVLPGNESCAIPNSTHFDLEMDFGGATYRLLIDVQSDTGTDKRVYYLTKNAPLPGDAWSEGWHTTNVSVDYPTTFGAHYGDFTPYDLNDLTNIILGQVAIGEKLSIYAMAFGDGGHDIHRNSTKNEDGAIVIGPDTANPQVLLFHFQDDPTF